MSVRVEDFGFSIAGRLPLNFYKILSLNTGPVAACKCGAYFSERKPA